MSENAVSNDTSTKEKLIRTGIELFSKYGYDGTTMRMIAQDANVNVASVSFYFGSKQNFYKSVLEYAAEDATPIYDVFYKEFLAAKESGSIDKDKAFELIEKLLSLQLYIAIDQPLKKYVSLLYWEQMLPPENCSPITEKVSLVIEDSLTYLLTCYNSSLDYGRALLISRFVNGGIIAFCEHPGFINGISSKMNLHLGSEFIKNSLKQFILNSIALF